MIAAGKIKRIPTDADASDDLVYKLRMLTKLSLSKDSC